MKSLLDMPRAKENLAMVESAFPEYLSLAQELIRKRSISLTGEGIQETALFVADLWRATGAMVSEQYLAMKAPIVVARIDTGAPVTVLLYGMYDVMPADEPDWIVSPFAGEVVSLGSRGECLVGRGADNSKGPLAGMIAVVKTMIAASGTLPVNLEIVIEGEEEKGSRTLREFLTQNGQALRPCDAVLFPEFCEYGGNPRTYLGFKGIVQGKIQVRGGEWGGPTKPTHSSNLPWINSPAWHLTHGLSSLANLQGDFFLQNQKDLMNAEDEALIEILAQDLDIPKELESRHTSRPSVTGDPVTLLRRLLTTTSFNISQMESGLNQAPSSIPTRASARFDIKLAPGVPSAEILPLLKRRLEEKGVSGAEVTVSDAYPGNKFRLEEAGVQALLAAYRALGFRPQIWPMCPGAAPSYAFEKVGAPMVLGGLGQSGNAHSANEYVTVEGMKRFSQSFCLWLHGCAQYCRHGEGS